MARNFKELQANMDPESRADNRQLVHHELGRMALDELRKAKQLTQADMAEMLDVPQSSISRIEQRADMYLSTLRSYIQAMGGVLQIQAVFPDGCAVAISRFGEYEDRSYEVSARLERNGTYRLDARPLDQGVPLSTKALKVQSFTRTLKALHLAEPQISSVRRNLEDAPLAVIGGRFGRKIFNVPDLLAAGFEATNTE
jgi:transcriptional regulator with XRE-family HTH domain